MCKGPELRGVPAGARLVGASLAGWGEPLLGANGCVLSPPSNRRASEEAFVKESREETPGTEWEKVAQLCDFNPKSSKQCKDVSRLRSVLLSLKQTPLAR